MKDPLGTQLTNTADTETNSVMNALSGINEQLESMGAPKPQDNTVQPITGSGSSTGAGNVMINPTEAQESMMGNNFNNSASQAMQGVYGSALARNRAASAPTQMVSPVNRSDKWYERKENRYTKVVEKGKGEKAEVLRNKIDKSKEFDKHKKDGTRPPKTYGDNMFTTLTS